MVFLFICLDYWILFFFFFYCFVLFLVRESRIFFKLKLKLWILFCSNSNSNYSPKLFWSRNLIIIFFQITFISMILFFPFFSNYDSKSWGFFLHIRNPIEWKKNQKQTKSNQSNSFFFFGIIFWWILFLPTITNGEKINFLFCR